MAYIKLNKNRVSIGPNARPVNQKAGDVIECCDREAHALIRKGYGDLFDPKSKKVMSQNATTKYVTSVTEKLAAEDKAKTVALKSDEVVETTAESLEAERLELAAEREHLKRQRAELVEELKALEAERAELQKLRDGLSNAKTAVENSDPVAGDETPGEKTGEGEPADKPAKKSKASKSTPRRPKTKKQEA